MLMLYIPKLVSILVREIETIPIHKGRSLLSLLSPSMGSSPSPFKMCVVGVFSPTSLIISISLLQHQTIFTSLVPIFHKQVGVKQTKGAMERDSWWSRMRNSDHGRTLVDNNKGRDPWVFNNHYHAGDDLFEGLSWPPRSYTCSFCKREFRSAQALGGHMNVHRRDRARLRQSPPWEQQPQSSSNNLSPNPNPNPSPNFSSFVPPPNKFPTFTYQVPSMLNSSVTCLSLSPLAYSDQVKIPTTNLHLDRSREGEFTNTMKALKGFRQEKDECNILKNGKMVMLDLEIGLCSNDTNEDLDLELRLGYS